MNDGLTVSDVGVRFRGVAALEGVGFAMQPGELTALIGPNGAGKSTLTNIVCGALPATTGQVRFAGRLVRGDDGHRVAAAGLVRTFQGLDLFERLTVLQNVMAGGAAAAGVGFWRNLVRPGAGTSERRLLHQAEDALAVVGLQARANDLAGVLPAGQRRLLAVARALATGARWLVLDEPGAGLNAVEKSLLVAAIRRMHEGGRTVLFIEHDMDVVHSLARRILVLDRGRLIADGTPAEIRADRGVIAAYLGTKGTRAPIPPPGPRPAPLIRAQRLGVTYGDVWALRGLDLQVGPGELVALVGANGAGKSTLLKTLAGVLSPREGTLSFEGAPLTGTGPETRVANGIALVPEGRELFASLTVEDNLLLGAWSWTPLAARLSAAGARRRAVAEPLDRVYALFPRLLERRRQLAGGLSGGEAQMVAIGRALMSRPRLLLLDEPSLGLAPMLVQEILERLRQMRDDGMAVLLVEQMAHAALAIADHGYMLERGRVLRDGPGPTLLDQGHLDDAYLGPEAMLERT